jgi:hypothetical protein
LDTDSIDSGDYKETQHIGSDITEENGELSDHENGLVGNLVNESNGENERHSSEDIEGNRENNEMVRLVVVEYEDDEHYDNEHYSEEHNGSKHNDADNSELVHGEDYSSEYEAAIGKDDDNDFSDQDAIDKPTFHQPESESANVALKLGDRPRQQVEMSLYSSTAKLDLELCLLLLLPAILVWRRTTLV